MQFKDYYATLGVSKTASQDEIRKAFRKLARQHHPDVAKDKKAAETKFKEINEANEVLGDPQKRAKYDELGSDWNQKDDVLSAFYPVSGIAADRETMRAAKGAPHPVAARILINWFVSDEFQNVGWYKEKEGEENLKTGSAG